MGTLHHHPFLIRYQGGAGDHVVQIRAGRTIRSGVGQSFCCLLYTSDAADE